MGRRSPRAFALLHPVPAPPKPRDQRWRPALPPGALELIVPAGKNPPVPGRSVVTFWSGSSGSRAQELEPRTKVPSWAGPALTARHTLEPYC